MSSDTQMPDSNDHYTSLKCDLPPSVLLLLKSETWRHRWLPTCLPFTPNSKWTPGARNAYILNRFLLWRPILPLATGTNGFPCAPQSRRVPRPVGSFPSTRLGISFWPDTQSPAPTPQAASGAQQNENKGVPLMDSGNLRPTRTTVKPVSLLRPHSPLTVPRPTFFKPLAGTGTYKLFTSSFVLFLKPPPTVCHPAPTVDKHSQAVGVSSGLPWQWLSQPLYFPLDGTGCFYLRGSLTHPLGFR